MTYCTLQYCLALLFIHVTQVSIIKDDLFTLLTLQLSSQFSDPKGNSQDTKCGQGYSINNIVAPWCLPSFCTWSWMPSIGKNDALKKNELIGPYVLAIPIEITAPVKRCAANIVLSIMICFCLVIIDQPRKTVLSNISLASINLFELITFLFYIYRSIAAS